MFIAYWAIAPLLLGYSGLVYYIFGKNAGLKFLGLSPFLVWAAIRSFEDATASLRSFVALFRMFKLSIDKEERLIQLRNKVKGLIDKMVKIYDIQYNFNLLNPKYDVFTNTTTWYNWLRRKISGRQKKDWNETLRLYDVPTDEFHLNPRLRKYIRTPKDSQIMTVDSQGNVVSRQSLFEHYERASHKKYN